MTLLITGSHGFLGRHLRLLLASRGVDALLADRHNWNELEALVAQADRIIHLAGVNRGSDTEVREGNLALADDVIRACGTQRARTIVYANTIHAGRDDAYGIGKQGAAKLFASWRDASEGIFVDIHLPNLFGEEGRPFYNSVVATFVEQLATGSPAQVGRAQIPLLHVQQAAHALLHACLHPEETREPHGIEISVADLWRRLSGMHADYAHGIIPDLSGPLDVPLFNTLRARMFRDRPAIDLTAHRDQRGIFVETAKVRGGGGQTSYSTTESGITRGEHYHLRKIERFVVISGTAEILIRHVLDGPETTVKLEVHGDKPMAVDMPTGWAHNITNIGDQPLLTQFWINEVYDPDDPDTFAERV